jgi:hypothetical protein
VSKTHNMTKWGLGALIVVGATVLPHTDELSQNFGKALNGGKELVCVASTAFSGIVTLDAVNCSGTGTSTPATPSGPSPDVTGG